MNEVVVKPAIVLTHEERHSTLWKKLEQLTADRLAACRRKNDGDLDDGKTAKLRGQISELKQLRTLLAMESSPAQETDG